MDIKRICEGEDGEWDGSTVGFYVEGFVDLSDFALCIAEECDCNFDNEIEGHEDDGNYDDNNKPLPHLLEYIKAKTIQRWFKFAHDGEWRKSTSFIIGAFPATYFEF